MESVMAIMIEGSTLCKLCNAPLYAEEEIVLIPAFIKDRTHNLFRFSDSSIHKSCFMNWKDKMSLIDEFNLYYQKHYRGLRVMSDDGYIENKE